MTENTPPHPGTFLDAVLSGSARPDDIGQWITLWRNGEQELTLEQHLGFTPAEAALWQIDPDCLELIIAARTSTAESHPEAETTTPPAPRTPRRNTPASADGQPTVATRTVKVRVTRQPVRPAPIPFLRPGYPTAQAGNTPYPACRHCRAPIRRIRGIGWTHVPTSAQPWRDGHFTLCQSTAEDITGTDQDHNTIAAPHADLRPARYRIPPPRTGQSRQPRQPQQPRQ